jgi:hypothetical protein
MRSSSREILVDPWMRSRFSFSAGTVTPGKRRARRYPFEITGRRSTRLYGIPLRSSISIALRDGCEAGIT